MQQHKHFTVQHDLYHAIALAARKAEYRQTKSELSGLKAMFACCGSLTQGFSPSILDFYDPLPIELVIAIEEARRKFKERQKAYRKAKNFVRNLLKEYWIRRIRFASRAIGNVEDYNLLTVPVPPTTVPADEIFMNYEFYCHQQGGASCACLA